MNIQMQQEYFHKGYKIIDFDTTKLRTIIDSVDEANDSKIFWKSKYNFTQDIRPSIFEFNSDIVEILFENNVNSIISNLTQSDLTLSHCQVRHVAYNSSNTSYMSWHRDTYMGHNNKWIGNVPAATKLIIYFDSGVARPRLDIIEGSHRLMFDDPDGDIGRYTKLMNVNNQYPLNNKVVTVNSSCNNALLFNTALLHNVVPETDVEGSIRVIYSFITRNQFDAIYAADPIHYKINEYYEKKLQNM